MTDIIAIFARPDGQHYIAFQIDRRWWYTTDQNDRAATWPSEAAARAYLGRAYDHYHRTYGERLPWDVDRVPVYQLEAKPH